MSETDSPQRIENISQDELDRVHQAYVSRSADDFLLFLSGLIVPSGHGPLLLHDVVADHQMECFAELAPSLEALRKGEMPPTRRFWIERTKKASKDTDIAACLLWLMAFPHRPLYIQIGAADRDQAAIVKRRIEDYLHYNPWLEALVDVQSYKMQSMNKMVVCDIIPADIAGSHGETPDLLVCNELSHVTKWEFILNLLDNADGVPQGLVIIATNAGYKGTQAWQLKQVAETNKDLWRCLYFKQPAPWHSEQFIADAQKRSTPSRFRRLWWGEWASGKGDAFDEGMLSRCFKPGLQELTAPEPGWNYIGGLDLGVSHDHAGFVVLGVNPVKQRLRLAHMRDWEPIEATKEVDLESVEEHCLIMSRVFRVTWLGYDPHQAKLMAQRLKRQGVSMFEVPFSGVTLPKMAVALMSVLRKGLLEAYDTPDGMLQRDLGKFNIVEKSYGYRLEAVRDETGHADVGTALAICLMRGVELLGSRAFSPDDDVAYGDDGTMSNAAIDSMSPEMRDLYDAC